MHRLSKQGVTRNFNHRAGHRNIMKVLIIEDNSQESLILAQYLARALPESQIETAVSLSSARQQLAKIFDCDLILLKGQLPDGNGPDFISEIGMAERPFAAIIYTQTHEPETAVTAIEAGADKYLILNQDTLITLPGIIMAVYHQRLALVAQQRQKAIAPETSVSFQSLVENAKDLIVYFDTDLRHRFVNRAVENLTGICKADYLGKTNEELGMGAEEVAFWNRELRHVLATAVPQTISFHFTGVSNETSYFEANVAPELNANGQVISLISVVRDITDRIQTQEKLHLQITALNAAANGIVITDINGVIQWVNPAFTALTGYKAEEALGHNPRDLIKSGKHSREFYKELWQTILAGKVWRGEIINRRKNGTLYNEEQTITPVLNEGGQIINFIAIKEDVTQRKQAETERKKVLDRQIAINRIGLRLRSTLDMGELCQIAYEELQNLVANSNFAIFMYDNVLQQIRPLFIMADGEKLDTSKLPSAPLEPGTGPNSRAILNRTPDIVADLQQANVQPKTHVNMPSKERQLARSMLTVPMIINEEVIGTLQMQHYQADVYTMAEADLLSSVATLAGLAIKNAHLYGAAQQELAERVRAENELFQQAQRLQQIIDTIPEGLAVLDKNGLVTLVNPLGGQVLRTLCGSGVGEKLEKINGRTLSDFLQTSNQGQIHTLKHADRYYELLSHPITLDKNISNSVLLIRDVTAEHERQAYLQTQERLATVGQLAAGIAHDFNNVMAVIILYTEMLLNTLQLPPQAERHLATISSQAQHAADMISQILDFSRRSMIERAPLNLLPLLKELIKLLQNTLPESIHIDFLHDLEEYIIYADPTRIQQAIMNIAVNARDAMPRGGYLIFTLTTLNIQTNESVPLPDMSAGSWLKLTITDTGEGIKEEHLPHIFEPFFTTKEIGKGTGLGLAQLHGIIKQHDGSIIVTSYPGTGTAFTIYLPLLNNKATTPSVPYPAHRAAIGHETIMIVEDNPILRESIMQMLTHLGYATLEVSNGTEALSVLAEIETPPAIILSDVVMPQMDGLELSQAIAERYPEQKMLFMTGYPFQEDRAGMGKVPWIQKPFDSDHLTTKLRAVLDESSGHRS